MDIEEETPKRPILKVRYKYAWGRHLYYPLNLTAKEMLKKYGRKNFTREQVKALKDLGVDVKIVVPDLLDYPEGDE